VTPDPSLESPGLEVVELSWERIQLVARLRRDRAAGLGPVRLFLRHATDDAPPLEGRPIDRPTAPDELLVRFNPFAAADQMPLAPGTWYLVAPAPAPGTAGWQAVPTASRGVVEDQDRAFPFGSSVYSIQFASPESQGARGPLAIEISVLRLDASAAETSSWGSLRRRLRRRLTAARHLVFHWLLVLCRALPGATRLVVFTSDSRAGIGGNLALVYERMVERGLDQEYDLRTIFRASLRTSRRMVDRARLVWLLARARVVLLEDVQPAVYRLEPRPDRRIIQLWHAWGAFKTVGYSRIGKPGGLSPFARAHRNYTYAIVSSAHEVPFYAEAFALPEERVVPTGTPRMDDFLDPTKQATRREGALTAIPRARDREVILFAPTFRGGGARTADYPIEMINLQAADALCRERGAIFVMRLHPFVERRLDIPPSMADRIFDATDLPVDTNDLLLISDLLVTDYSSLIFEYAALNRPMLFFAYDQEEYVATRDFYEPYETFVPGRIVRSFDELVAAIRARDYQAEKVEPFARRHLPSEPGSATDRIIDQLILGR
jgi:CDP-ribitol ribitolphosphotransferase